MSFFERLAAHNIITHHPEAERLRFRAKVMAALSDTGEDFSGAINFRPDVFLIDRAKQEITLWEIEDTSPIDEGKLFKIVRLWDLAAGVGWRVRLVTTDRYGIACVTHDLESAHQFILFDKP